MTHLTESELQAVLEAAKAENESLWLMLTVAYNHGLRVSEMVEMTGRQVGGGRLYVERKKGSLATSQLLCSDEKNALEAAGRIAGDNRLFPMHRRTALRHIQRLLRQCGIENPMPYSLGFHSLKHSCGKLAAEKGVQLEKLQRWMGHKNLNSTAAYIKCNDDEAFLAMEATR